MHDRSTKWARCRTVFIEVYPLFIIRGIGEFPYSVPIYLEPRASQDYGLRCFLNCYGQ
jgi:hypothetical protein